MPEFVALLARSGRNRCSSSTRSRGVVVAAGKRQFAGICDNMWLCSHQLDLRPGIECKRQRSRDRAGEFLHPAVSTANRMVPDFNHSLQSLDE